MFASHDREGIFDARAAEAAGGRSLALAIAVAISAFASVGSLSLWQLTAPRTATVLLEAGISSTVDVDRYLDDQVPALQEWASLPASDATILPAFPVEVVVTADEVKGSRSDLRDMVLDRSAAVVYGEGTPAFDRTGDQSIDLVSGETVIRLLVDNVNAANHRRSGLLAVAAAILFAVSAVLASVARDGRRPLRPLGAAVMVGAIPGVVLAGVAHLLAGQYGADGDQFAAEVRRTVQAAASIPLRNYLIVFGAGVAVVALGMLLDLAGRVLPAPAVGAGHPR